jgi:hypothetical protein
MAWLHNVLASQWRARIRFLRLLIGRRLAYGGTWMDTAQVLSAKAEEQTEPLVTLRSKAKSKANIL